jgi:drug/metabolite transporter (DMT)-like permease
MYILGAIICGLLSMATYGLSNVQSQPLAKKIGPAQMLFLRGIIISVILAICAISNFDKFTLYKEVFLTLLLGMAGYLPVLAFTHGIKISRISIISPIAGTSPLVTVLLSFFILKTAIHPVQWLAIVVVIGANVVMSIDLKNIRNSNALQLSSGIPYALIATLGWGCFYFFLVYATTSLGPWVSAFLVEAGVTIAAGLHLLFSHQKTPFKKTLSDGIIINGMLICIGTVAFTVGVRYFNVGIVATLSNSVAIVSALVATYMLHEHLTRKEKLAAIAMIAGIIALTIF